MMAWIVEMVLVSELAIRMTALERSHPPAGLPMVAIIDITRVLLMWRYKAEGLPS